MKKIFQLNLEHGNRIFGLDVLRALAILFVVIQHGAHLLPDQLAAFSLFFCQDGVSIFFVLSGFLIGGILIKLIESNTQGWSFSLIFGFWIRRWLRTLPAFVFVLSILVLVYILFKPDFDVLTVAPYILFIQNFSSPHPSFFPEAWSLSVEEWFYCLLPIFVVFWTYFCKFAPKKSFVYTIVLCIIIVMAFRYYRFVEITLVSVNDWDLFFRKQVITRLDSLMYGVLGGWIAFYYPQKWSKYKKLVFFVGLFFLLFDRYFAPILFGEIGLYSAVFSFSIISFSVLLLLPFLSTWKTYYGFLFYPIMYISLCSYSMYLLNLSVLQGLFINRIAWSNYVHPSFLAEVLSYIVYWVLVLCSSILLYKYIELPAMKWRNKFKISVEMNR